MNFADSYIYKERESRIKLDAVHSTLQEVLNGNVDKALVEESLAIVEELRDQRITDCGCGTHEEVRDGIKVYHEKCDL